jgi:protein-tyrosine phosphatase
VSGYIDLHSHWVAGVDDGASTVDDSRALLHALRGVGFDTVVATPHMRTGMFDNTRAGLERAYAETVAALGDDDKLPELSLSSEHHLDDVVFQRLIDGEGLPYRGGKAALIEFPDERFPVKHRERLFDLRRRQIRPVIAHPERYRPVWKDIASLDPLLDGGAVLLLDVAALVGKYGRRPQQCAHSLLEEGYYYAACSDAHRAADADSAAKGIDRLIALAGKEEADFLLRDGPRNILQGTVDDS